MTSPSISTEPNVRRGTAALLLGTVLNGIAAYAFIVIGTRSIGAEAYAPIPILWTLWSFSVAILTIPLQHWIVRLERADGDESALRASMPSLLGIVAGLAVATALVTWSARSLLFHRDGIALPFVAGCIPIGALAVGVLRGVLVGRGRLVAAAVAMVGENIVRVAGAVVVAARGGDVIGYAIALLAGFAVVFAFPRAFVLRTSRRETERERHEPPLAFLAGIAGGSLLAQLVLTSGPLVLAVVGGPPEQVTALFAALSLFGAPYLMALGVAPQGTKTLTGLVLEHRDPALRRVRHAIVVLAIAGGTAGAVFGSVAGAPLVQTLFGSDVDLPTASYVAIGLGSTLALATLAQTLVLVAHERGRSVALCWTVAAVVFIAVGIVPVGTDAVRVTVALAVAEAVALVVLLVAAGRGAPTGGRPSAELPA